MSYRYDTIHATITMRLVCVHCVLLDSIGIAGAYGALTNSSTKSRAT